MCVLVQRQVRWKKSSPAILWIEKGCCLQSADIPWNRMVGFSTNFLRFIGNELLATCGASYSYSPGGPRRDADFFATRGREKLETRKSSPKVIVHANVSWRTSRIRGTCKCVVLHVNASWHMWMSPGTYEWIWLKRMKPVPQGWVISPTNESCCVWMRHAANLWVMLHMDESCCKWMSDVTWHIKSVRCALVTSHQVMAQINASHTVDDARDISMSHVEYGWVMSRDLSHRDEIFCRTLHFYQVANSPSSSEYVYIFKCAKCTFHKCSECTLFMWLAPPTSREE